VRGWREYSAAGSALGRGPRASLNTGGRCSRRDAPQEAGAGRERECFWEPWFENKTRSKPRGVAGAGAEARRRGGVGVMVKGRKVVVVRSGDLNRRKVRTQNH